MRIALVNHLRLQLPHAGRPAASGSIGHFCFEVAIRFARRSDCESVVVYSPKGGRFARRETEYEGVTFVEIPTGIDEAIERSTKTLRGIVHRARDRARPPFASRWNHGLYARRVATDIDRRRVDVVQVTNRSQFVAPIRARRRDAIIDLHMQCEWLSQIDPAIVGPRVSASTLVSGCSEFIVDQVRRAFPDEANKCFTLHNGVDVDRFRPASTKSARSEGDGPHIVFAGRLSPEKGVHDVVAAFARALEQHPSASLTLIGPRSSAPFELVGELSRDPSTRALERFYRDEVTYVDQLLASVGPDVARRIEITGNLDQDHLAERLRTADYFMHPSVWHEPFGMAVLEAMATGLPVIATKSGGIPEFVEDGRTGVLVERGATDELSSALLSLMADPERAKALGIAARNDAVERWTWDHVAARLHAELDGGSDNASDARRKR